MPVTTERIETPTQTVEIERHEDGVWLRILSSLNDDDSFFDDNEHWAGDSVWLSGDLAHQVAKALIGG